MMTDADTLFAILTKIKQGCQNKIKPGLADNLDGLIHFANKIRKKDLPKTIGVFGAQKRGKSSLINQLLGCDLMPTGMIPMTSTVIEVKNDEKMPVGQFTVNITSENGFIQEQKGLPLPDAQALLRQYGSHKGLSNTETETIRVTSYFPESKILVRGGILIDTPGAEKAFETENSNENNQKDIRRAESILKSTSIFIFVERADYIQNKSGAAFFNKNLKNLQPLCVVNMKELAEDEVRKRTATSDPNALEANLNSYLCEHMVNAFHANFNDLICVSCKEAKTAKKNSDKRGLEKSDLPRLENQILQKLDELKPEVGVASCLNRLQNCLNSIKETNGEPFVKQLCASVRTLLNTLCKSECSETKNSAKGIL